MRNMYLNLNELTILYNGKHLKSRQTVSLARSQGKRVNAQDISNTRVSVNLFCNLLDRANVQPKTIVNKASKYYQNNLRGTDFSDEEWFYILMNNPDLLVDPIIVYKQSAVVCKTPTDVLRVF